MIRSIFSGLAGGLALGVTAGAGFAGFLATGFVLPVLLFALMLAYQGVRLGRSTHLVDMADQETRAAYTALSNTIIGILLLAGSGFSLLAAFAGPLVVLAVMAVMCALACFVALGLEEVQEA